jgi:DNA-binding MarR family transcriptional regulator
VTGSGAAVDPADVDMTSLAWQLLLGIRSRLTEELTERGFTDLRPGQNALLYNLAAGTTRITELARQFGVTAQAVSFLVDQLEKAGYVTRAVDPADRRARIVELTERGRSAADCVREVYAGITLRWENVVGADRVRECGATLAEMVAVLHETGTPGIQVT